MMQWFILRKQEQFGPYTSRQLLEMASQGQLYQGDMFARSGDSDWVVYDQALPQWQEEENPAFLQTKKPKKKRKRLFLVIFLLISAGLITLYGSVKPSNNLSLGKKMPGVSDNIPMTGGDIIVSDPTSSIHGLAIHVPENAYTQSKDFKVSTREIKSHSFGASFTPITPLITIDNGHEFSQEIMTVTIPVTRTPGKFAMGFFYDKKTGQLEGIPFTDNTSESITLITNHFSEILIAETDQENLQKIKVDTGFLPGYDDWQFTNRGSWAAPKGHCAGQSITMMWYFTEKYLADKERRLYGRFDNNTYGYGTIDFWKDDALGYRFCSVVQSKIDWASKSRKILNEYVNTSSVNTYCAFAFSMMMTGEPQYLAIRGDYTNEDGETSNVGHAIVAYKIDAGTIYVADPNYPGTEIRKLSFTPDAGFATYNSGLNAEAIAQTGEIAFDKMFYTAKTALIDYSTVAELYKKISDGTIGIEEGFPTYSIEKLVRIDPTTGIQTWEPMASEYDLDTEDTKAVHPSLAGKVVFRIKPYSNLVTSYYNGISPVTLVSEKNIHGSSYASLYTIELDKGLNHIGFLTEVRDEDQKDYYNDFKRIKINYEQEVKLEFLDQPYEAVQDMKTKFEAATEDVPSGAFYLWDFGDGTELLETKKPVAEHTYDTEGPYEITLSCIDKKNEFVLAESSAQVDVYSLYGEWDLVYTIEEAGSIDFIINMIVQSFVQMISEVFGLEGDTDIEVTIKNTVVECLLQVIPPEQEGGEIGIQFQQLTSSTDFLEVSEDIMGGRLTVKDDKIEIKIITEGEPIGFTFKGVLDSSGMRGDFNATIMKGSFNASHR